MGAHGSHLTPHTCEPQQGDRIADVMAVRTAEIDAHIRVAAWGTTSDAPTSNPSPSHGGPTPARVSQLVIVGELWSHAACPCFDTMTAQAAQICAL